MKAISPMVAVVLLIAFTVGVGGLVSIFVTGLTTTSTGITSNQSESLTRCAGSWLDVYSVSSTRVNIANPNSQTIVNIAIIAGSGEVASNAIASLAPGATSGATWTSLTNTSVNARGLCQSLVTVEGRCTSAQDCWDV
ncbi:MAG: hypothetical protein AABW61_02030 [Candidatus Aenigmatarchaeota archaeon]